MTTSFLTLLFGENQPYDQALQMPCDIVLELLEVKLEERLHYLEDEKSRLALKELAIVKEYGSVAEFSKLALQGDSEAPEMV